MSSVRKHVSIITSSICSSHKKPGAYGIVLKYGEHRKELLGGFPSTTKSRVALYAIIVSLQALNQPCDVTVYASAKFIVDTIHNDAEFTQVCEPGFPDSDRWQELELASREHTVTYEWLGSCSSAKDIARCQQLAIICLQASELSCYPDQFEKRVITRSGHDYYREGPFLRDYDRQRISCPHGVPPGNRCHICDPE